MIMPYGRKPTEVEAGHGPAEIDFNALWDRGYVPVIQALGYHPVRADQDTGALVITQMLERLYFADLVLADMTIANVNVYYEVGIRHAAKEKGCVLLAAEWSRLTRGSSIKNTYYSGINDAFMVELRWRVVPAAIKFWPIGSYMR